MASATTKPRYWTEAAVFERLRHVFPGPAYERLSQVRNGTGYARSRTRTADALVLSVWPSRGLWIAGVEIKVSRSDWKKELAHADKSCEIQQYCKRWYVAAPAGVVPHAELPETWGLIEVKDNTATIAKAAPDLDAKPPDMLFVCSILRNVADCCVPAGLVKEQISAAVDQARGVWERQTAMGRDELKMAVAEFEKGSATARATGAFSLVETRWQKALPSLKRCAVRSLRITGVPRVLPGTSWAAMPLTTRIIPRPVSLSGILQRNSCGHIWIAGVATPPLLFSAAEDQPKADMPA